MQEILKWEKFKPLYKTMGHKTTSENKVETCVFNLFGVTLYVTEFMKTTHILKIFPIENRLVRRKQLH